MKTGVFLQARMDSSRLPGKALKYLEGKTVIEHAMNALSLIPADEHILVTARGDEKYFKDLAFQSGFKLYAGSREDVLQRFIDAGKKYQVDIVVRATGDNPLVAFEPATFLLHQIQSNPDWDYTAMRGLPYGCGVEVFRFDNLMNAAEASDEKYDHEHVTPYIYNNPEKHRLVFFDAPREMCSEGRVTLDTEDDYISLRTIFKNIYHGAPVGIEELVKYLKKHD